MIISTNAAFNLYWLGRYMQRTLSVAKECISSFDYIIDKDFTDGQKLFAKLGIDITYKNEREFLKIAVFGDHPSSISGSLYAMKENSVRCRDKIYSHAFAYVNKAYLDIHEQYKNKLGVYHLERLLANLYGLDGVLHSTLMETVAVTLIDFGKSVEKIDMNIRLFDDMTGVLYSYKEACNIGKQLSKTFSAPPMTSNDKTKLLVLANTLVDGVIKA